MELYLPGLEPNVNDNTAMLRVILSSSCIMQQVMFVTVSSVVN